MTQHELELQAFDVIKSALEMYYRESGSPKVKQVLQDVLGGWIRIAVVR